MGYGFRMYYFRLHERFGRSPLDLSVEFGGETAEEFLATLLSELTSDQSTRWAMPSLKSTAEGDDIEPEVPTERGHKAIKWLTYDQPGTLHFSAEVRYGSVQGHDFAIGPSEDVKILGAAPSHKHRVEFLLPKDGDTGLLIAEDVDRSCPGLAAAQWLGKQSKMDADGGTWWRMKCEPLSDEERLDELIKNTKRAEIRLKVHGKTLAGSRYQNPLTITAEVDRSDDRKRLIEEVGKWRSANKKSKGQGILVLAEVAGVEDLDPDEADLYLQDASTGRRVKPHQLDDVFIYETGDSKATAEAWKSQIMARLSVLSGTLGFDVVW